MLRDQGFATNVEALNEFLVGHLIDSAGEWTYTIADIKSVDKRWENMGAGDECNLMRMFDPP